MSVPNDQLTRAERIRLEAFAQACNSWPITYSGVFTDQEPIDALLERAEVIEKWLKAAPSPVPNLTVVGGEDAG